MSKDNYFIIAKDSCHSEGATATEESPFKKINIMRFFAEPVLSEANGLRMTK